MLEQLQRSDRDRPVTLVLLASRIPPVGHDDALAAPLAERAGLHAEMIGGL